MAMHVIVATLATDAVGMQDAFNFYEGYFGCSHYLSAA
jgi:hypothetical protein